MREYPEYKASGVDWIEKLPCEWHLEKLKFKADIQFSNVDKLSDESEIPVFLCNYVDVYKNEKICSDIDFMQATANANEIKKFKIKKGDVIITKDSESVDDIAVPALAIEDFENVLCGYHLAQIKVKKYLSGEYLFRLFQSKNFNQNFESSANGMTRYGLSVYSIKNVFVTIPTPKEQQTIVNFLDYKTGLIDKFIANRQKQIELLKEQKAAIINKAVTKGINPHAKMKASGIEWIGEIPEDWQVVPFKKRLKQIIDYRGKTPDKKNQGIFLVTARNIKNGVINYDLSKEYVSEDEYNEIMSRGKPMIGDVLFTMEAPLGQVANVDKENIAIAQRIIKVSGKSKYINNYYLKLWLSSKLFQNDLQSYATGSTVLGIKASKLNNLKLLLPPKKEQQVILDYIKIETTKIGFVAQIRLML